MNKFFRLVGNIEYLKPRIWETWANLWSMMQWYAFVLIHKQTNLKQTLTAFLLYRKRKLIVIRFHWNNLGCLGTQLEIFASVSSRLLPILNIWTQINHLRLKQVFLHLKLIHEITKIFTFMALNSSRISNLWIFIGFNGICMFVRNSSKFGVNENWRKCTFTTKNARHSYIGLSRISTIRMIQQTNTQHFSFIDESP